MRAKSSSAVATALLVTLLFVGTGAITFKDVGTTLRMSANERPELTKEALSDKVSHLPGWGSIQEDEFGMFAGYVTVDEDAGRALFYIYVESRNDPAKDPVVLWLNGGPGCSSLGGGFLSELGPFYPTPHGQLQVNDYAWNHKANVLFIEAPAFVGFSYSNSSEDRVVGDKRTAQDNHTFLKNWFKRFPHLQKNPFWISGESYAGHYVPTLAAEIIEGNKRADETPFNFKGLLVGNAWTDPVLDNHGALDFWYSHGLIAHTTYDGVRENCDFSRVGPLKQGQNVSKDEALCDAFVEEAMNTFTGINIYDIYADVCLAPDSSNPAIALGRVLDGHRAGLSTRAAVLKSRYDPCVDNEVEAYLNRKDVQEALHVIPGLAPKKWKDCTHDIHYSRDDVLTSMLPVWHELLESGLDMLVYTGDVDAIVPVTGTRAWFHSLALPVKEKWRPWVSATGQVGGWTVRHAKGLTFASVRGAGHMVPYTQPERAYHMFNSFVQRQRL